MNMDGKKNSEGRYRNRQEFYYFYTKWYFLQ